MKARVAFLIPGAFAAGPVAGLPPAAGAQPPVFATVLLAPVDLAVALSFMVFGAVGVEKWLKRRSA